MSEICEPIWQAMPLSSRCGLFEISFNFDKASSVLIPNLSSFLPVWIYSWLAMEISGLILMPRGATVSSSAAIFDILSISEKDSALIENIPDLIANAISCSDFPTPEKINFPASMPSRSNYENTWCRLLWCDLSNDKQ